MSKPVQFVGIYKDEFENFIKYRKSLGYKYGIAKEREFFRLNIHLNSYGCDKVMLTERMVREYIELFRNKSVSTIHGKECNVRQFGLYLKNIGYEDIYIFPESSIIWNRSNFVPYIFTKNEISSIFTATDQIPIKKNNPIDRLFFQTIYRLLYATGMRVGEAVSLKVEDVNLENDIITVHNGKDRVSRLIPFLPPLHYWLNRYTEERGKASDVYFFQSANGQHRDTQSVRTVFITKVLPAAGINPNRGGVNVRVHDLRHTFACHVLNKLVQKGADPFCALPYLSVYMGHKDIKSTELYLRLTEDRFKEITDAGHCIYEGLGDWDD